jgi:hypothetical protein
MNRPFLPIAFILLGICIVFSSLQISEALEEIALYQDADNTTVTHESNEWEMIVVNEDYLILFNHNRGQYWTLIENNEGVTEWQRGAMPGE